MERCSDEFRSAGQCGTLHSRQQQTLQVTTVTCSTPRAVQRIRPDQSDPYRIMTCFTASFTCSLQYVIIVVVVVIVVSQETLSHQLRRTTV